MNRDKGEGFNYLDLSHYSDMKQYCGIYMLANPTELTCTWGRAVNFKNVTLQTTPEGQCTGRLSSRGRKAHHTPYFFFPFLDRDKVSWETELFPLKGLPDTGAEGVPLPNPIKLLDEGRELPKGSKPPGVRLEGWLKDPKVPSGRG